MDRTLRYSNNDARFIITLRAIRAAPKEFIYQCLMKSNLRCHARYLNKNVGWVEAVAETQRIQNNPVGVRFAHPNLRAGTGRRAGVGVILLGPRKNSRAESQRAGALKRAAVPGCFTGYKRRAATQGLADRRRPLPGTGSGHPRNLKLISVAR